MTNQIDIIDFLIPRSVRDETLKTYKLSGSESLAKYLTLILSAKNSDFDSFAKCLKSSDPSSNENTTYLVAEALINDIQNKLKLDAFCINNSRDLIKEVFLSDKVLKSFGRLDETLVLNPIAVNVLNELTPSTFNYWGADIFPFCQIEAIKNRDDHNKAVFHTTNLDSPKYSNVVEALNRYDVFIEEKSEGVENYSDATLLMLPTFGVRFSRDNLFPSEENALRLALHRNGKSYIVLSLSSLKASTGKLKDLQTELALSGRVESIILFGSRQLLLSTSIPTVLLTVAPKNDKREEILFADLSTQKLEQSQELVSQVLNSLERNQLQSISARIKLVSLGTIKTNGCSLYPTEYVLTEPHLKLLKMLEGRETVALGDITNICGCQSLANKLAAEDSVLFERFGVVPSDINQCGLVKEATKRLKFTENMVYQRRVVRQMLEAGDIVITTRGRTAIVGIIPEHAKDWYADQFFSILRLKKNEFISDPYYLCRYLLLPEVREYLDSTAQGFGIPLLSGTTLEKLPVIIPNKEEELMASEELKEIQSLDTELRARLQCNIKRLDKII